MNRVAKVACAAIAVVGVAAVGYGAAWASSTGARTVTKPEVAAKYVPHAGPGKSERPPARPDSIFVPIKACRIVNTSSAGGRIGNGSTRSFYVVGSTGFSGQGGASTGCGIPPTATAISARVTAVSALATGGLNAYPSDVPTGGAILYYPKTAAVVTGATLALASGTGKVLTVKNVGGPTQLIIDVAGYYDEQLEGMISPAAKVYAGSNGIVSAVVEETGEYEVTFDRDVSDCSPMIDTYNVYVYGSAYAFDGTHVTVFTWSLDSTTHLEAAANDYFYITVTC
jgi:hypothetical protein